MIVALIPLIGLVSKIITVLILARVVISWINPDPSNRLVSLVYRATEPMLRPVRSILPTLGGIDFSPILVLIGVQIAEELLVRMLIGMAGG